MNDRFKFRFYDNDKKIMIDENSDTEYIASIYGRDEWYWCIEAKMPKFLDYLNGEGFVDGEWCKFNFAIMQCTGLKDKNGKLIYEGDIMNVLIDSLKPHYIKQVVVWDRKEWQLKAFNKDYRKNCSECGRQLRTKCKCCSEYFSATGHTNFKEFYNGIVIGNIYENKELLNEVDK